MAEQQRIHPVDVEAAALVSRKSVGSEKGDPDGVHRPYARTIPVQYMPPPRRRRNCCLRCCCWTLCLTITLLVLVAVTAGALYLIFRPKAPKYSVDKLSITNFQVNPVLSETGSYDVGASFDVTVTASNPNKAIGIYYVDGSSLSASYRDTQLCEGQLPVFYQGHRNTTVFSVLLSGKAQLDNETITSLKQAQDIGSVPLVFHGKVPVKIKFGALKLWKVKFLVTCDIVASGLSVVNPVSIKSSDCSFKFRIRG